MITQVLAHTSGPWSGGLLFIVINGRIEFDWRIDSRLQRVSSPTNKAGFAEMCDRGHLWDFDAACRAHPEWHLDVYRDRTAAVADLAVGAGL